MEFAGHHNDHEEDDISEEDGDEIGIDCEGDNPNDQGKKKKKKRKKRKAKKNN